jgi:hypothetical protein
MSGIGQVFDTTESCYFAAGLAKVNKNAIKNFTRNINLMNKVIDWLFLKFDVNVIFHLV